MAFWETNFLSIFDGFSGRIGDLRDICFVGDFTYLHILWFVFERYILIMFFFGFLYLHTVK